MLMFIFGELSAISILTCARMSAFPQFHRFMKVPFWIYLITTPLYLLSAFSSVGLASLPSVFPYFSLVMFLLSLLLRVTTARNTDVDSITHSWLVAGLTSFGAVVTLLFAPLPYFIFHLG